jgi:predicted amidohydrolase
MRKFNRRTLLKAVPLASSVASATPAMAAGEGGDAAERASVRIGLAALRRGKTVTDSVHKIDEALAECREKGVEIVCFPETYLPGLRGLKQPGKELPEPNQPEMEKAVSSIRSSTERHKVSAIVGLEWVSRRGLENRAYVFSSKGELLGYQTKNQITPGGEEEHYVPDGKRRIFETGGVRFGIVVCHEGWRYPETVRWAAVRGAKIVFQPQVTGQDRPGPVKNAPWGESFYEKAMVCRSEENSVYFASVNETMNQQNSATSLISPDGDLMQFLPRGEEGLLVADLDLSKATGFYASRYRPELYEEDGV